MWMAVLKGVLDWALGLEKSLIKLIFAVMNNDDSHIINPKT